MSPSSKSLFLVSWALWIVLTLLPLALHLAASLDGFFLLFETILSWGAELRPGGSRLHPTQWSRRRRAGGRSFSVRLLAPISSSRSCSLLSATSTRGGVPVAVAPRTSDAYALASRLDGDLWKTGGLRMLMLLGVGAASLLAWIGVLFARGLFWWPAPRLAPRRDVPRRGADASGGADSPSVVAVIPARDEAAILPETLPTVLGQDYGGPFRITLVDDRSEDGTADVARATAEGSGRADRLTVLRGEPMQGGWSGKVWAMHQGARTAGEAEWIWFTDADIAHEPWVLGALVSIAVRDERDLVSTMATLRIVSVWDRLLIPAFVYFFAKLYPFRFVANPSMRTAGAAGGCILVRRRVLEQAGGVEAIRGALIDDCALGRLIKRTGGRLWLGYSKGVQSLRGYGSLRSVWDMVARSAYTQLGLSSIKLIGTILGMLFLYALPPVVCISGAIAGAMPLAILGGATWGLMAASFVPMLRRHRAGGWIAPLLPLAGVLYTAMTISSAWRHLRGRGGAWKGRTYSGESGGL